MELVRLPDDLIPATPVTIRMYVNAAWLQRVVIPGVTDETWEGSGTALLVAEKTLSCTPGQQFEVTIEHCGPGDAGGYCDWRRSETFQWKSSTANITVVESEDGAESAGHADWQDCRVFFLWPDLRSLEADSQDALRKHPKPTISRARIEDKMPVPKSGK